MQLDTIRQALEAQGTLWHCAMFRSVDAECLTCSGTVLSRGINGLFPYEARFPCTVSSSCMVRSITRYTARVRKPPTLRIEPGYLSRSPLRSSFTYLMTRKLIPALILVTSFGHRSRLERTLWSPGPKSTSSLGRPTSRSIVSNDRLLV